METMKEDRSFMYMVEINEKFIVIAAHDGSNDFASRATKA
jgi:hypothetical protein